MSRAAQVSIVACLLLSPAVAVIASRAVAPSAPAPAAQGFVPPEPIDYADRDGWERLFDGRTLDGWSGNPDVWSVEDGAIVARSTPERRVGSTFLIWQGGELADFELKLELKLEGDIHSGVAYRSFVDPARGAGRRGQAPGRGRGPVFQVPADPQWTLYGYGLDYDYDRQMAGNVEERGTPRREIAWRGGIVRAEAGKPARLIGSVGDADALLAHLRVDDWNQLHVIAAGRQLTHIINGHVMTILIDDDDTYFRRSGVIGLQIEQYGFGTVRAREIWIRRR